MSHGPSVEGSARSTRGTESSTDERRHGGHMGRSKLDVLIDWSIVCLFGGLVVLHEIAARARR